MEHACVQYRNMKPFEALREREDAFCVAPFQEFVAWCIVYMWTMDGIKIKTIKITSYIIVQYSAHWAVVIVSVGVISPRLATRSSAAPSTPSPSASPSLEGTSTNAASVSTTTTT